MNVFTLAQNLQIYYAKRHFYSLFEMEMVFMENDGINEAYIYYIYICVCVHAVIVCIYEW